MVVAAPGGDLAVVRNSIAGFLVGPQPLDGLRRVEALKISVASPVRITRLRSSRRDRRRVPQRGQTCRQWRAAASGWRHNIGSTIYNGKTGRRRRRPVGYDREGAIALEPDNVHGENPHLPYARVGLDAPGVVTGGRSRRLSRGGTLVENDGVGKGCPWASAPMETPTCWQIRSNWRIDRAPKLRCFSSISRGMKLSSSRRGFWPSCGPCNSEGAAHRH